MPVRPTLADSYFDWESEGTTVVTSTVGDIVAVAQTCNAGPINTVVPIANETKLYENFGYGDTPLHRGVLGALKGHGSSNGRGGARVVLAVRQAVTSGGGAATKAVKTLANTASAVGVTLTAREFGSAPNATQFTVQDAAGGGKELLVLEGSRVVERHPHAATDLAALVASINASSEDWTGVVTTAGTALANASGGTVTTGGTDGATLTGAEWAETFTTLDRHRWAIFAAHGLTDPTIRAAVIAWIQERNDYGMRSFLVIGGALNESIATANTRSEEINDWNVINLGGGSLTLTDTGQTVSTAEFVGRYAGARAWRGERHGDMYVRFEDVEVAGSGATIAEQEAALASGTTVFTRDTEDVPVYIREAVTTYTDDSQSPVDAKNNKLWPVDVYSNVKWVAIQHAVELEMGDFARSGDIIGKLGNTEKTRELILSRARESYRLREAAEIVQPGWTVGIDGEPNDDDDFVAVAHAFHPIRSLRQVFNVARIG